MWKTCQVQRCIDYEDEPDLDELDRLTSAGWEPYAVTWERRFGYSGSRSYRVYHLRRREEKDA